MIFRLLPAAVALTVASCATPAPIPPAPSPTPLAALSCRGSQNGDDGPSPDSQILLDAAALPTRRALEANDAGDGWLFAKVGLFVRPHLAVELSVEPGAEAAVTYGPGDRSRRVVLPQCTQQPGRWIVYTGGY